MEGIRNVLFPSPPIYRERGQGEATGEGWNSRARTVSLRSSNFFLSFFLILKILPILFSFSLPDSCLKEFLFGEHWSLFFREIP
jgi:hypothetical protein